MYLEENIAGALFILALSLPTAVSADDWGTGFAGGSEGFASWGDGFNSDDTWSNGFDNWSISWVDDERQGPIEGINPLYHGLPTECHPSYSGRCLLAVAPDYDCIVLIIELDGVVFIALDGDGPGYTRQVTVVGPDVFGLDRDNDGDNDGVGCELAP